MSSNVSNVRLYRRVCRLRGVSGVPIPRFQPAFGHWTRNACFHSCLISCFQKKRVTRLFSLSSHAQGVPKNVLQVWLCLWRQNRWLSDRLVCETFYHRKPPEAIVQDPATDPTPAEASIPPHGVVYLCMQAYRGRCGVLA